MSEASDARRIGAMKAALNAMTRDAMMRAWDERGLGDGWVISFSDLEGEHFSTGTGIKLTSPDGDEYICRSTFTHCFLDDASKRPFSYMVTAVEIHSYDSIDNIIENARKHGSTHQ